MDINNDRLMDGLTNVKCETVIYSFMWKDDFYAYISTSIKGRLDELIIKRLDLKLWKLGMKLNRV